jgi:hypothetical protein
MNITRCLILLIAIWICPVSAFPADSDSSGNSLMKVIVVPQQELIVIQFRNLNTENIILDLTDKDGKIVGETFINAGSTIGSFDTQTLYAGEYSIIVSNGKEIITHKITLTK